MEELNKDSESSDTTLFDLIPLSKLRKVCRSFKLQENVTSAHSDSSCCDDSDKHPTYTETCRYSRCGRKNVKICQCGETLCTVHLAVSGSVCSHVLDTSEDEDELSESASQPCQVPRCQKEIFAACVRCFKLLCWDHFDKDEDCSTHVDINITTSEQSVTSSKQPIDFPIEGGSRENTPCKRNKFNKQTSAKKQRDAGQGYIQQRSLNLVPPRRIGERCNSLFCQKGGRRCKDFSEEERNELFKSYYKLESLQLQREYINHYVESVPKLAQRENSRRQKSTRYHMLLAGKKVIVCKKFFLNTLGISERTLRTALVKLGPTGVVEPERRGGRSANMRNKDAFQRKGVEEHIKKFPKVESHYCRQNSSREYLHPDLTIPKMYSMYVEEIGEGNKPASIITYQKVFNEMNLSIHRPKKDQCSLCETYKNGDITTKDRLKARYTQHTESKTKVREIKDNSKTKAKENLEHVCAAFDLQQVMYLPISKESAIFYKRRLSVFNFTIYNIGTKDCHCYVWHEGASKRGSSEMATCVYSFLKEHDDKKVKSVDFFADGCSGQNKNSIIATALLYVVNNSKNVQEISLRFFEPYHGQSEGDSAHSAIGYAMSRVGEISVPSQILPIIKLARRKKPYHVIQMEYSDFLDFKKMSKDLRVLSVREDDECTRESINWTEMVEFRVKKDEKTKIFFKTSHSQTMYRSISLKRLISTSDVLKSPPSKLNDKPPNISVEKFNDLMTLCAGECPIIRNREHVRFYEGLDPAS